MKSLRCAQLTVLVLLFFQALCLLAQSAPSLPLAPAQPPPDARFKTDILVIVAHPDDETEITEYLARAIFDQHKRVAVLFGTPGNSGGNVQGPEQADALGAIRQMEARRALATFGVTNVWFLGGSDTPGHNPLRSLEAWHHGSALEQAVRLVRLTRPEVILTWLPDEVVGENHGDHQAASIIATEAFDLAGDPTAFPEQVAAPDRGHLQFGNLTEGLRPWQPEKLYFFSDAIHFGFMKGKGPQYASTDVSPSRHLSYARLAAEEERRHLTQDDTGAMAVQELKSGDLKDFVPPNRFIFGKSVLPTAAAQDPTADLFAGVVPGPVPFAPAPGYRARPHHGIWLRLGEPWNFYQRFWRAHGLRLMPDLLAAEKQLGAGETLQVPLVLHNDTGQAATVAVIAELPSGWRAVAGEARYPVPAGGSYPVSMVVRAPKNGATGWQTIGWQARGAGVNEAPVRLRVFVTR